MHLPTLTPMRYFPRLVPPILFSAVLLSGCSKFPPTGPAWRDDAALSGARGFAAAGSGYGSASFYPLSIGDSWTYEGGGVTRVLSSDGYPPWDDFHYAFTETRRLIGTTHHEGTVYVVEEQVHHDIPESYYGPGTIWARLRQDTRGLYSLDTLLLDPPTLDQRGGLTATGATRGAHVYRIDFKAWRAGDATDESLERFADRVELLRKLVRGIVDRRDEPVSRVGLEVRLLTYPLHPGTSWSNRPDFPWPSRVDRVETLDTPAGRFPAYRIDIVPWLFDSYICAGNGRKR